MMTPYRPLDSKTLDSFIEVAAKVRLEAARLAGWPSREPDEEMEFVRLLAA